MVATIDPNDRHALNLRLSEIDRAINEQRLEEAIEGAEGLLDIPIAATPALALLALACALNEQIDRAIGILEKLPQPEAMDKAETSLAIGSAHFKIGRPSAAIAYLQRAHALIPEHPLVRARLGACLLGIGRDQEAMPHLHAAVEQMPEAGGAWLNLARGHLHLGEPEQALAALERAEPLPGKEPDIFAMTRAETLSRLGRSSEALAQLRDAIASGDKGSVEAAVNLLGTEGQHDQAWQILREALERTPDQVDLLELAAELAQIRGRFGEADHFLDRALSIEPENAALWRRRAMLAGRRLGPEQGRIAADKALELTRESGGLAYALALTAHAHVLTEEEKHEEAEVTYREALALAPQAAPALGGLGSLLMQLGKVDEAIQTFEQLKQVSPIQGWSQLIHARQIPDDPKILERMGEAARRPSLQGPVQTHLLFTLASAWDKCGDHQQAWTLAEEANRASRERLQYRPEAHRNRIEREMARFSRTFMQSRSDWGNDSDLPVFVLGMPRSGTTLIEQILGSHSQVHGAGELSLIPELIQKLNAWEIRLGTRREYPECIADMSVEESRRFAAKHLEELRGYAPEAARIVDKLPHNFEHIGLIKLLFPKASILHLKREPRDVAMSNFFVDYSAKFGGMGFAYDLTWIGEQLVDHQRSMQHWQEVFPGEILDVDYDDLVEDVEGWARRIIGHLGLPWEDSVLDFQKLDRAVKTASVWQVRQPVYKTSKARWKSYEAQLGPLESALADVPPPPVPSPLPKLRPGLFLEGMERLGAGQPKEAETCFIELVTARPAHAAGHHFLGAALYQQGRLDEARKSMQRSLELLPRQPQWLENLAKLEDAAGQPEEAARIRSRLRRHDAETGNGKDVATTKAQDPEAVQPTG